MIRMILIVVVLVLALVSGVAVAMYHYFGAKGLLVLPVLLLAIAWVGKKMAGVIFKKVALGLFGMKSGVLKGATTTVHSIVPVAKPPERQIENSDDEDGGEGESSDAVDGPTQEELAAIEAEDPKHYYNVDLTITPQGNENFWEPSEFILTSEKISNLEDMEEKDVGQVHDLQVWDGNAFGPDDPGKYPGEQRLLITFAVKPGTTKAWLHYYNETLGLFEIPEWRVEAASAV